MLTRDLAAEMVAVVIDTPGALRGRLEQHLDAFDEETLVAIGNALPLQSLELMEFSLRIAKWLVNKARVTAHNVSSDADETSLRRLAHRLNSLGIRLSDLGCREEALAAGQEAVAICKHLVKTRPDAFLPDLAGSFDNLGMSLCKLGRREEALAASHQAAVLYRHLSETPGSLPTQSSVES
jgi:hypothetical protein